MNKQNMDIVFVGHVDHGKSTVLGRILADTHTLPKGKLERIQKECARNGKTFEYAFLLDALKDEQKQGITIDAARCFFKTKKRAYTIIDAPGHIEFLKNMISGASRAEAAILVIDAKEGIAQNSKRHCLLLSLLGINNVIVCVNKMDLVSYDQHVFDQIQKEFTHYLKKIKINPQCFIPVSAIEGENIVFHKNKLTWFKGPTILSALDSLKSSDESGTNSLRMTLQDVYRFSLDTKDSRRIFGGRIEAGSLKVGDEIIFYPSQKCSTVQTIESFNTSTKKSIQSPLCTGITLSEQVYLPRGELIAKKGELKPFVSTLLQANIFWMGKEPLVKNKLYKLKILTKDVSCRIKEIISTTNSETLQKKKAKLIKRHEIGECIISCTESIVYDLFSECKETGRFVLVDDYEIAGGGIITLKLKDGLEKTRKQVGLREQKWYKSIVKPEDRITKYSQTPMLILITGKSKVNKKDTAMQLERKLFDLGKKVYYLGIGNLLRGLDSDIDKKKREEHVRRLGETSHILMDAGLIVIATASDLTEEELTIIRTINDQNNVNIITIGKSPIFKNTSLHIDEKYKSLKKVDTIMNLIESKENQMQLKK